MQATLGRSHAVENAARLANRGDLNNALREYARLFQQDPGDWSVGNALGDLYLRTGKSGDAVSVFTDLAERLAADGFAAKARALYRKVLRIQPNNPIALQRVDELEKPQVGQASPFLQRVLETARTTRETVEAAAPANQSAPIDAPDHGTPPIEPPAPPPSPAPASAAPAPPTPDSRSVIEPERPAIEPPPLPKPPAPAPPAAPQASPAGNAAAAPGGLQQLEAVVHAAVARRDFQGAIVTIQHFLAARPQYIPALELLIDVAVDGEMDSAAIDAQVRLARACVGAARYAQAREIAVDLMARQPGFSSHRDLLEDVIATARKKGVNLPPAPSLEPDAQAAPPAPPTPPRASLPPAPEASPRQAPEPPRAQPAVPAAPPQPSRAAAPPGPAPPTDALLSEWTDVARSLEEIRNALLDDAASAAEDLLAEADRLIGTSQFDEALRSLEVAMCTPHLRVPAGARVARIHRDRGALMEALSCLEWVAELPPSTEDGGHELAYELAVTLEALGQHAQALGVYRELLAEVGPGYRDLAGRVEHLRAP